MERTMMALILFVAGILIGILIMNRAQDRPVCHAPSEDSAMVDCEYRDGGWWRRP